MNVPEFEGIPVRCAERLCGFLVELIDQLNQHAESIAGIDDEAEFGEKHAKYLTLSIRLMEAAFPRRSVVRHLYSGKGTPPAFLYSDSQEGA